MTILPQQSRVDFNLYLITDRTNTRGRGLSVVIEDALKGGVKGIQLREKDLSSRDLFTAACELRKLTNRYGARLLINDRIDIALAVDADGVHLGSSSIPPDQARKILGRERLIGVSCHDRKSAVTAEETGADFITLGPVFHTPSKAVYGEPTGVALLGTMVNLLHIPVFALGGINCGNAPQAIAAGVHGISLISAVMAAEDPRHQAEALLSLLPPQIRVD